MLPNINRMKKLVFMLHQNTINRLAAIKRQGLVFVERDVRKAQILCFREVTILWLLFSKRDFTDMRRKLVRNIG